MTTLASGGGRAPRRVGRWMRAATGVFSAWALVCDEQLVPGRTGPTRRAEARRLDLPDRRLDFALAGTLTWLGGRAAGAGPGSNSDDRCAGARRQSLPESARTRRRTDRSRRAAARRWPADVQLVLDARATALRVRLHRAGHFPARHGAGPDAGSPGVRPRLAPIRACGGRLGRGRGLMAAARAAPAALGSGPGHHALRTALPVAIHALCRRVSAICVGGTFRRQDGRPAIGARGAARQSDTPARPDDHRLRDRTDRRPAARAWHRSRPLGRLGRAELGRRARDPPAGRNGPVAVARLSTAPVFRSAYPGTSGSKRRTVRSRVETAFAASISGLAPSGDQMSAHSYRFGIEEEYFLADAETRGTPRGDLAGLPCPGEGGTARDRARAGRRAGRGLHAPAHRRAGRPGQSRRPAGAARRHRGRERPEPAGLRHPSPGALGAPDRHRRRALPGHPVGCRHRGPAGADLRHARPCRGAGAGRARRPDEPAAAVPAAAARALGLLAVLAGRGDRACGPTGSASSANCPGPACRRSSPTPPRTRGSSTS